MTTTLRRLGFMLLLVLALAQHKDIEAQDHKTHSIPDTEVARCVNAAREACANVAAQMIASIEATCGHFGLGWACGLARSYWNAPREKDAEWVNGKCQQEALKQCTTAKP